MGLCHIKIPNSVEILEGLFKLFEILFKQFEMRFKQLEILFKLKLREVVIKKKGIRDAGSTADIRMLWPWSALVCLGLL